MNEPDFCLWPREPIAVCTSILARSEKLHDPAKLLLRGKLLDSAISSVPLRPWLQNGAWYNSCSWQTWWKGLRA